MTISDPIPLILLGFSALVAVFWAALSLDPRRRWPRELVLPAARQEPTAQPDSQPTVVALVPARDEAEMLPSTLPALLCQDGLRGVVLVDDGSSDGTGDLARRVAAEHGVAAFEMVRAPPRPVGWAGKVHAQAAGLRELRRRFPEADWVLLTDADIRHRPGSVRALLARAEDGYDLVSVMARLHTTSFWEKLLVPPFVYFFQLLYPFRQVPLGGERTAAAAGGCVLLRIAALERAGGFEAIRGRLIDDVALAKAVARTGGRVWLGLDEGIESVRPYPLLRDLWRMVARSAFVQLDYRWTLVALVLAGLLAFLVSPPLGLAASLVVAVAGGAAAKVAGVGAAGGFLVAWTLQAAGLLPAVRHHRLAAPWALALPFASLLYALMTLSSALAHRAGRSASWRGRRYGAVDAESSEGAAVD